MASKVWKKVKYGLFASGLMMIGGAVVGSVYFNVADKRIEYRVIAYCGVLIFACSAIIFLRAFTGTINKIISNRRLGAGRAGAIQLFLRVIGYIIILMGSLELMNISVSKLLLGGAIVGIILGVAAQQSLANFFASIVLIITHPYRVGEEVTLFSGSLGGKYEGVVLDIGLTHTRLKQTDGKIIYMPNATLLAGAAIIPNRQPKKHS